MKYSKKDITVGTFSYCTPTWGEARIVVDVVKQKAPKDGEFAVRFCKGFDYVIMDNIPDTAIFETTTEVVK